MTQYYLTREDYLVHHGIKGQKWGERRYQNEDGSLTPAGREHYGYGQARADRAKSEAASAHRLADRYVNAMNRKAENRQARYEKHPTLSTKSRAHRAASEAKTATKLAKAYTDAMDKKAAKRQAQADYYKTEEGQAKLKARQEKIKKAAIVGAAVVATAVAAYGAYKVHEIVKQKQYDKAMSLVKTAKFQDTLHGRYRDIASNYGTNYRTRYDGINGIKKDTYDYNMSSGPTTKLEYNIDKYRKYYDKAESARIKSGTAANKANSQYIKYLGGSLTSKGRKLKKDLANGNSSFDANNVRKYRNAG